MTINRNYYTSVNGRITALLIRIPNFRPLSEELISEIDSMSLVEREDVRFNTDAIIGLMQVQINELKIMNERASTKPKFRIVG